MAGPAETERHPGISAEDLERFAEILARLLASAWRARQAREIGPARAELLRVLANKVLSARQAGP
jgi:hypothetical protein